MKMVRELGLIRRKTVWFLSSLGVENCEALPLVREDRGGETSALPVVLPRASLGRYVST
jgi:hypothetical protein